MDKRNPTSQEEVRFDARNHQLCNALNNTCDRWAMTSIGSSKCDRHGGKTPRGIASPHFKNGRRSKYLSALPAKLKDGYVEALKRKDLLTNGNEIALLDARLAQVLELASFGEAETVWASVKALAAKFQEAMVDKEPDRAMTYLPELIQLIEKGGEDWLVWNEVVKLVEQRRKLVESESKRLLQSQETLTSGEAFLLFNALVSVVQEHITDRETRAKLQMGFSRIVAGAGQLKG